MTTHPQPETLGQLRQTAYRFRTVKQELRGNLIHRLRQGERIFPGILGYDNTVLPQISHEFLTRMMEGEQIDRVQVSAADGQFAYAFD